jgi:hypothetical protein
VSYQRPGDCNLQSFVEGLANLEGWAVLWGLLRRLFRRRKAGRNTSEPSSIAVRSDPAWVSRLPPSVLIVDVETTGLTPSDRIITFAGIGLRTAGLPRGQFEMEYSHHSASAIPTHAALLLMTMRTSSFDPTCLKGPSGRLLCFSSRCVLSLAHNRPIRVLRFLPRSRRSPRERNDHVDRHRRHGTHEQNGNEFHRNAPRSWERP